MSARAEPGAGWDAVAELADRYGVLLAAGIAPRAAWELLDEAPRLDPTDPAALWAQARAAPSAEREAWRALAVLLAVAGEAGAPLATALARAADLLREAAQAERELDVARAGPAATGRIVLALPPLGLLVAQASGVDALGALLGSPVGWVCLAAGTGLVLAGRAWTRRMLTRVRRLDVAGGFDLDALAVAVGGGLPPGRARELVAAALRAAELPGPGAELDRQLAFAERAGVPLAGLLRAEAAAVRRRSRAASQRAVAELATRLLLPLGLCVLPAFVLLGVVPVIAALVSSTAASW